MARRVQVVRGAASAHWAWSAVRRRQAVHLARHDPLTALPNRVQLAHRLAQALRAGRTPGLLLLDLDGFKDINGALGHRRGDEVLAQVGPRLRSVLDDGDTVARLGDDEFGVLLPQVDDVAAAAAIAAGVQHALGPPFRVGGLDLAVEASIGLVVGGIHGQDTATLLRRAGIALNVAKSGRLGIVVYDPATDRHTPAGLALTAELRAALERRELTLHYQPKIDVATGVVVGAEALVRWPHPSRGLLYPDAFIPAAERTGLIGPLTRYVLDAALAQARRWADLGHALPVAVNLSARNLLDENLPDDVAALLGRHGVPAALLHLELTESAVVTEPVRAHRILQRLADLGITISIDDFGVGFTSLGQLKSLPVSELKIDRSFITPMTGDRRDAVIVHSIIGLGHDLGLTIVAEGVETADTLAMLTDLGCDTAQGYHIARPATADTFDTWMHDRRNTSSDPVGVSAAEAAIA